MRKYRLVLEEVREKRGLKDRNYKDELLDEDKFKCPHCKQIMVISDKALNAYNRKLLVKRTQSKNCPYCQKEIAAKK